MSSAPLLFYGIFFCFFIICGTNSPVLWDKICYETNLYIGQNISTAMGGKCCVQWNKVSNILGENRPYHERNFLYIRQTIRAGWVIVQELCESRGGRPGLSVLTSLLVSVDVKIY